MTSSPASHDELPFWLTIFIDLPASAHEQGRDFWSAVTGWPLSAGRGDSGEFSTLVPDEGDPHLKLQRVGSDSAGTHLDVHVTDSEAALQRALDLGAEVLDRSPHGYVVCRSPGGYTFCLVTEQLETPASPTCWPAGQSSLVDQLCLDIPSAAYPAEVAFWSALTGLEAVPSATHAEFTSLRRPDRVSVRLLLQRQRDETGTVRGHLDLATTNRALEVSRHESLGATSRLDQPGDRWTVMQAPTGETYCITDRHP